jgi:hypothetical protein
MTSSTQPNTTPALPSHLDLALSYAAQGWRVLPCRSAEEPTDEFLESATART